MKFQSILDKKNSPSQPRRSVPVFMVDLNADQVIEKICKTKPEEVRWMFHYFPEDEESEAYRRGVYADIKKPEAGDVLGRFRAEMEGYRMVNLHKEAVISPLQKKMWHLEMARIYTAAFSHLSEGLSKAELESEGMQAFRSYLDEVLSGERFLALKAQISEIKEELQAFRVTIHYENDRMILSDWSEGEEDEYERFLRETFPTHQSVLKNLFGTEQDFTNIERELMDILTKKHPDFFRKVNSFWENWKEFWEQPLLLFAKEIEYYLAFWEFQQEMTQNGYAFCTPKAAGEDGAFSAKGVYDLALALAKGEEREIIDNDFCYEKDEQFFVVTGPNQGGKTTYARSLGQLLYFAKMGFDVPAREASLPYFEDIMTHFSVEESVETGRGKLMDELARLSPMVKKEGGKAYVIINELFTTAANFDAIEMGCRTLRAFLDKGYYGIYVTHLGELAGADERIVSLMAGLDESGHQNYKVTRQPAVEMDCAILQVEQHKLEYEQIKERLSCM